MIYKNLSVFIGTLDCCYCIVIIKGCLIQGIISIFVNITIKFYYLKVMRCYLKKSLILYPCIQD